jgi:hypothetical protein
MTREEFDGLKVGDRFQAEMFLGSELIWRIYERDDTRLMCIRDEIDKDVFQFEDMDGYRVLS